MHRNLEWRHFCTKSFTVFTWRLFNWPVLPFGGLCCVCCAFLSTDDVLFSTELHSALWHKCSSVAVVCGCSLYVGVQCYFNFWVGGGELKSKVCAWNKAQCFCRWSRAVKHHVCTAGRNHLVRWIDCSDSGSSPGYWAEGKALMSSSSVWRA